MKMMNSQILFPRVEVSNYGRRFKTDVIYKYYNVSVLFRAQPELLTKMHGPAKGLVFAIYYPILAAFGIPANLAVIMILARGRCGLSRCITYYLVSMAVSDLLVMITAVIFNRISGIYFPVSFLMITPVCSFRSVLNYAIIDSSVWLTVAFTFDRFIAICFQQLQIKYCTTKTAARVIAAACTLSCVKNTFLYFIYEPLYTINNVPWFCNIKSIFYTSPAWTAYDWIHHILTPCLPFALIILLNSLTIRHILVANRARRRLRIQTKGKDQIDSEIENRKKSIILLFCVSGNFILLYLLVLQSVASSTLQQTQTSIEKTSIMKSSLEEFKSCHSNRMQRIIHKLYAQVLLRKASLTASNILPPPGLLSQASYRHPSCSLKTVDVTSNSSIALPSSHF
ncbi:probable G-protein coupled receptor 142 [Stegostoma tigrinum]|uniref:probable G-protein coupled receptor 142 n=1 Tax=Stegostoma tigrinum TaxID=3053191 RepID=UPI0028708200|nr:probable G-protein coupled receptor 142 [Stegostoma tigrinum]